MASVDRTCDQTGATFSFCYFSFFFSKRKIKEATALFLLLRSMSPAVRRDAQRPSRVRTRPAEPAASMGLFLRLRFPFQRTSTPRHATDPPHPRLIHLVQQESAPGRQKRASWLLCSLTGMTLKAPKSPPQPVRLTDSEDVFCKAVGLDSNDHNDRLLLSEVKVGTQIERCFYVSHTG